MGPFLVFCTSVLHVYNFTRGERIQGVSKKSGFFVVDPGSNPSLGGSPWRCPGGPGGCSEGSWGLFDPFFPKIGPGSGPAKIFFEHFGSFLALFLGLRIFGEKKIFEKKNFPKKKFSKFCHVVFLDKLGTPGRFFWSKNSGFGCPLGGSSSKLLPKITE